MGEPFTYERLIASLVPAEREQIQLSVKEAIETEQDYCVVTRQAKAAESWREAETLPILREISLIGIRDGRAFFEGGRHGCSRPSISGQALSLRLAWLWGRQ